MSIIHSDMKEIMRRDFPKYKRVQIAATLTELEVHRKKVLSKTQVFGITLSRKMEYSTKLLQLIYFTTVYRRLYIAKLDQNDIYVAVDESNKTVYWNYKPKKDELV